MPNILINNNFYQGTSQACITDLTPPTFAGVVGLSVQSRGQFRASWATAVDATLPLRYEVYAQATTAVGLFAANNVVGITSALQFDFWTLRDGSFLVNGTTYHVGVRARDGVSNIDSNVISLNAISTGIFVSSDVYQTEGAFAFSTSNELQGTLWVLKNDALAKTGTAVMGTAAYQVYDKQGNPVVGMTESGLTANAEGQYIITPIASTLALTLDHYVIKLSITVDSAIREGYSSLIQEAPKYDISGLFFVNAESDFDGTFWVSANEVLKTANLGVGAYQVFDHHGNAIVGMNESGITANADGIYNISHIPSLLADNYTGYSVRVTIVVDSITRVEMFAINASLKKHLPKAQFSINALNQFQGTIWVDTEGSIETASLGAANYTVYNALGVAVVGLTESGIVGDANGRFPMSPVSAVLLTDLTHYSVKIGVIINGQECIAYKGFTLLGN